MVLKKQKETLRLDQEPRPTIISTKTVHISAPPPTPADTHLLIDINPRVIVVMSLYLGEVAQGV